MFFTDAFFRIDLQINFLVLPELGNQYVVMKNLNWLDLGVVLGNELDVSGVDVGIL